MVYSILDNLIVVITEQLVCDFIVEFHVGSVVDIFDTLACISVFLRVSNFPSGKIM